MTPQHRRTVLITGASSGLGEGMARLFAERAPFIVDTEKGCRAMVDAIEREGAEATVPAWPWRPIGLASRLLPLRVVRRLM